MTIDNQTDLDGLRQAGRLAAQILQALMGQVMPGVQTIELDEMARKMMADAGAQSAPIVTYNYPGSVCISVNEEIAHGIPGQRMIQQGDVVNIDVSLVLNGYFSDNAATMIVGGDAPELQALCDAARAARDEAISMIRPGVKINTMGRVFQKHARSVGARVIRDLCSHGIGRKLHEQPDQIVGYYNRLDRRKFKPHQVLTVEPFLSTGAVFTETAEDGWTLLNQPGGFSAQFEHTIVVRPNNSPEILTVC